MGTKLSKPSRQALETAGAGARIGVLAVLGFLSLSSPAHADPLLLEAGQALRSPWLIMAAGLALEAVILGLFIRRAFIEVLVVCLLANAITGFCGLVALMLAQIYGVPVLPPGPTALAAGLIEASLISIMLVRPPIRRVFTGAMIANLVTALLAVAALAPRVIQPASPTAVQDLTLARGLVQVRQAIDEYYDRFGYFPSYLAGGNSEDYREKGESGDPLLSSGILESYPPNPYAPYLRSRHFTAQFLLLGIGPATRPVDLNRPATEWEARWFPIMKSDPRFGDPDHLLLCANGLSDMRVRDSLRTTFYHMNGTDYIPGCFFYRGYDFNGDGLIDDYILGAYGWPTGSGTVGFDLIDRATGEISLHLDSRGLIHAGQPDGRPEAVLALYVANRPIPEG